MIKVTSKFLDYRDFRRYGNIFVETGSAAGDGIQRALDAGFTEVHSIEAAQLWYDMCMKRFEGDSRVHMHLGRSTDVLKELWGPLGSTFRIVFFLDAHPSGPLSAGHSDVISNPQSEASQDNVIKAELQVIWERFPQPVIIIDDQGGLDIYSEHYIHLLQQIDPSYLIEFYDENLGGSHFYKNKLLAARYE